MDGIRTANRTENVQTEKSVRKSVKCKCRYSAAVD